MSNLSTTFTDVLIEGNTLDYGFFTADNITTTQYSYQRLLQNTADAIIKNNIFSGMATATGNDMLNLSGDAHITDNNFIRGTSTINSYINCGSNDHIITHNIFDSPTVDGTNESIVINISSGTIYEKNKNQTGYAVFSFGSLANSSLTDTYNSGKVFLPFQDNGFPNYDTYVTAPFDGSDGSSSSTHTINGKVSGLISDKLPANVQLLYIVSSFVPNAPAVNFAASPGTAHFFLYSLSPTTFSITSPADVSPASFDNSIVDVNHVVTTSSVGSNTLNFQSTSSPSFFNSQYVYADLSLSNFFTSNNKSFYLTYTISVTSATDKHIGLLMSAIGVKYRW